MGKTQLWKAIQEKQDLLNIDHFCEEACRKLEALDKTIQEHEGYAAESQAASLLEGLGLPGKVHALPMNTLSGGYKLRVLLAQLLFSKPDVLLLDEPTNHLDLFSIRWLEGYLKEFPGTLLISSHDRFFLNTVCNHIVDMDYETIKIYKGNFDRFEETKAADRELKASILEKQDKKREDLQEFVDRFRAKSSKARQAQSKLKLVEKIEEEMESLDIRQSSRMYPNLQFNQVRPPGAIALTVKDISKSYGEKLVLQNVSFEVERGDRIAFIGPNGVGKSTLLEILTGNISPCKGSHEWGFAAQAAYFPQEHARIVKGQYSLLDWLSQQEPLVPEQRLRETLARVLFSGDDVLKLVGILSGGETARLVLAKMILQKHNILIFDEPTNHLDMEATENLLTALQEYPGTLLLVSHNRHFISRIANRIIEMTPDGLLDFRCSFEEYLAKRDVDHLSSTAKRTSLKSSIDVESKNRFEDQKKMRNQRAQLEKKAARAEEQCHHIEMELLALEDMLATEGFYQNTPKQIIEQTLAKKAELEKKLESAMTEWESAANKLIDA